jgi:pyruvate kinase
LNNRRAKIVCTLGPSSNTYDKIKVIALAGMDVARLNFSHGTHENHLKCIQMIRQISVELQKPIAILQDLQGPKIRVQTFEKGRIKLKPNQNFIITTDNIIGNDSKVAVSYPEFTDDVKPGDFVLLNDGLIKLQVEEIIGSEVNCRVIFGGYLSDHKGLNLPGSILSIDPLTGKDLKDLEFGIKHNVDYIALSFVQKAADVKYLKTLINNHNVNIPIIAKIEKPQAVEDLTEIVGEADAIMVARGDLGVEVNAEEVPSIQKKIIKHCNTEGIPVITATQMLESMIHNPRPTRAEASDVANAVLDGSDAVMLSGETAMGKYPLEAVETMDKIIHLIENDHLTSSSKFRRRQPDTKYSTAMSIGHAACDAAELINAKAIVCLTQSGLTARTIARFRPETKIIAITPKQKTLFRLALIWGIESFSVHEFKENIDDATMDIKKLLLDNSIVNKGDSVVITAGLPFTMKSKTNMLRIEEI